MAELRNYQKHLLEQAVSALIPAKARVMLQLPTGGGKTHIAGALLRRWLRNGRKAVWLTHRTELADQTCGMLSDAGVSAISLKTWQSGDDAPSVPNGVVILMAQTVGRRTNRMQIWGKYRSDDLLVIDEAHHATADGWERAIEQWPGRVIGLTATPWRLSVKEGIDHLFSQLHCGPQVSELQADKWLCQARVLMPKPEEIIRAGAVNTIGEYSESGIEQANRDRPDVMTAGALRFWQSHATGRQTVVYAISQDHARNLTTVFNDAGIAAAVMLSDTLPDERAKAIESFGNGTLRVLVNVAVATEGFDLPDASCVVITRPTMSLALYLQMVGRGLRPKPDGGDCLILDLAGNAEVHGLPEDERQWSLEPRGSHPSGDAPVVRCENCDALSPAASHFCIFCEAPFGKDCARCGQWRATERWSYENHCGDLHELVCNLCHYDAHIQGQLPVTDELRRLTGMEPDLEAALRHLLEEERLRAGGADEERKSELRSLISDRESELTDDARLNAAFEHYVASLPIWERPRLNGPQKYRLYGDWEEGLKEELAIWKDELDKLEAKVPNGRLVYNNAKERVLQALESEAQDAGLIPQSRPNRNRREDGNQSNVEIADLTTTNVSGWMSLVQLGEWGNIDPSKGADVKPKRFREPNGIEVPIRSWPDLIFHVSEWTAREGPIATQNCPVTLGNGRFYLINFEPVNSKGKNFHGAKKLSNGLYVETNLSAKRTASLCEQLLVKFGQDPAEFHVLLG